MLSKSDKKQLKYAARIGRKYDHNLFWAELTTMAMFNARPENRYAFVSAKIHGGEWQFYYHRTALEALKYSGLNALYFSSMHHYSKLVPMTHLAMFTVAKWSKQC